MHTCTYYIDAGPTADAAFFVRHIIHDNDYITDAAFAKYLNLLGMPEYKGTPLKVQARRWDDIPIHFSLEGLRVEGETETPNIGLKYDYYFDSKEDFEAYLEHIDTYVKFEKARKPLPNFKKRATVAAADVGSPGGWWNSLAEVEGGMAETSTMMAFTASTSLGSAAYAAANPVKTSLFSNDTEFPKRTVMRLTNGRLIQDESNAAVWERTLGTDIFPDVGIAETLRIYKHHIHIFKGSSLTESKTLLMKEHTDLLVKILDSIIYSETLWDIALKAIVDFVFSIKPIAFCAGIGAGIGAAEPPPVGNTETPSPPQECCDPHSIAGVLSRLEGATAEDRFEMVGLFAACTMSEAFYDDFFCKDRRHKMRAALDRLATSTSSDLILTLIDKLHYIDPKNPRDIKFFLLIEAARKGVLFREYVVEYSTFLFETTVAIFVQYRLERKDGSRVFAKKLWNAFEEFLKEDDSFFTPVRSFGGQEQFKAALEKQGFVQKRFANGKAWMDVSLGTETPVAEEDE